MNRNEVFKQCGQIIKPEVTAKLMGWLWKSKVFQAMDENLFFHYTVNNEVRAFMQCSFRIRDKVLVIDKIGVSTKYRKQGYGKILVNKALTLGHPLRLDVVSENKNAIIFYEKIGFKPVGTKQLGKLKDIDVTIMLLKKPK